MWLWDLVKFIVFEGEREDEVFEGDGVVENVVFCEDLIGVIGD